MKIIEKTRNHVVLEGKLSKMSKRYLGFYLPKELEKEYGKRTIVFVIIQKKVRASLVNKILGKR